MTAEYDRVDCPVEGTVPSWLSGTLLRNGPGLFEAGDRSVSHWFDGLAMLRRYHIEDGSVTFSNRFLRSEEYQSVMSTGALRADQFATTAEKSRFERLTGLLSPVLTDNASVNIDRIGSSPIASTETPNAVGFDTETLSTTGSVALDDGLDVTGTLAHPHYDFATETVVNMGVRFGLTSEYVLVEREPAASSYRRLGGHSVKRPAYIHSFGLTEHYVVLFESPLRLNPRLLLRDTPFIENYTWDGDRPGRLLVFDRASGSVVATPAVEPRFVFHHVNAFERDAGSEIVVDLVAFEDDRAIQSLYLNRLRRGGDPVPGGELRRYRLSVDDDTASEYRLFEGPIEFPMVNYSLVNTRPYRYLYAAHHTDGAATGLLNGLVKLDLANETVHRWSEPGVYAGEPIFVARIPANNPSAQPAGSEDDGVILSVVLDTNAEQSMLVVLDAATFDERARITLPTAIPFGFHGQFYRPDITFDRTMA